MRDNLTPGPLKNSAAFSTAWHYWQSLRDGASLPRRSAVRLQDLDSLSLNIHLVEWLAPAEMRFRFVGLDAVTRAHVETLGHNHFEHMNPTIVPAYVRAFAACREMNCGVTGRFHAQENGEGRQMDLMHLPLLNADGEPRLGLVVTDLETMILGGFTSLQLMQNVERIHIVPLDTGAGIPWAERDVRA